MRRQVFLTERAEPLANWRLAFPDAEVREFPSAGRPLLTPPGSAVIWLHLKAGSTDPVGLLQRAAAAAPGCPRLVLSNIPSDEEGLAVLEAGAMAYTNALATPDLLRQIELVVENGGVWVGPDLMQRLLTALANKTGNRPKAALLDALSPREREVALAVAAGASNKEIARRLEISERTVKAHLSAIFQHLGVRDRLQLSIRLNGLP